MKKVTAYISTVRVHWLVEELEARGINEIMVTEYFSPSSKISRLELFSQDDAVKTVCAIIHRVGTTGEAADHSLFVEDFDPKLPSQIPLGKRTSKLEETRVKQLVNFLLRGTHSKIRTAFLLLSLGVLGVALFIYSQAAAFQRSARKTAERMQFISQTTHLLESGMLEEMLSVERFHRGEAKAALGDFLKARVKLVNAVTSLEETNMIVPLMLDSLKNLEHGFHLLAGGMFKIVDSLAQPGAAKQRRVSAGLFTSHANIMSSLDVLRLELLAILSSLAKESRDQSSQQEQEMNHSIDAVRLSLLLLAIGTIVMTVVVWLVVERNVSRPIRKLVEEAKTIDTMELR